MTAAAIPGPRSTRIQGLEVGRGAAAVLVLLLHASAILAEPRFYGHLIWNGAFTGFGAGVDFFFVLSGFIIASVHWDDIGRPQRLRHYAVRRFRRIYPPYWGVLVPLTLLYFLFPGTGKPSQHDPSNAVASFLLIPWPDPPILGVAWTLVYEMIFYLIFAAVIVVGRRAWWVVAAWGAAALVAHLALERLVFPFNILLDLRNLQFLMGIAAAGLIRLHRMPLPRSAVLVGAAGFLALLFLLDPLTDDPLVARIGFGASAVLVIVGMVGWERREEVHIPFALRELGAASYSIYLVHGVAISIASQVINRSIGKALPIEAAMAALVVAGVTAGILYHEWVEKPLNRRLSAKPARQVAEPVVSG